MKFSMLKRIYIHHPPTNALDCPILYDIYQNLQAAEKDSSVGCVLLESKKPFIFSSGLDLRRLLANKSGKIDLLRAVWLVYRINQLILRSSKIYIALLDGGIIGSAVSIVMACDFRIASDRTWLWLPDPQYGGLLTDGGLELLQRSVGFSLAKKFCMTNERINSQEAYDRGLFYQLTASEELQKAAGSLIENILTKSYTTLKHTKAILNRRALTHFPLWRLLKTVYSKELEERLKHYRL